MSLSLSLCLIFICISFIRCGEPGEPGVSPLGQGRRQQDQMPYRHREEAQARARGAREEGELFFKLREF
jgi:hypothetical protein